jgi:hypothetical protein
LITVGIRPDFNGYRVTFKVVNTTIKCFKKEREESRNAGDPRISLTPGRDDYSFGA